MNNFPQFPQYNQFNMPKKTSIDRVYGRQGVDSFPMAPNCEAILLDTTAPIAWLVKTDSAGYKVSEPYDLTPHQEAPQIDMNNINERLTRLEARFNEPATTDATGSTATVPSE